MDEAVNYNCEINAGKEKSVGVSFGSPYIYYDYCNNFPAYIHAFNPCDESQIAVVKALFGEIPFEGFFPYDEPGKNNGIRKSPFFERKTGIPFYRSNSFLALPLQIFSMSVSLISSDRSSRSSHSGRCHGISDPKRSRSAPCLSKMD